MTDQTPTTAAGLAAVTSSPVASGRTHVSDGRSRRMMPLMRRVEIVHRSAAHPSDIVDTSRLVPAIAAFDDAFAAFARGTLFPTDRGMVAVEDLLPGDCVRTADDGFQPLVWRGATVLSSRARGQDASMGRLTRIAADALGVGRPMPDLVLGPRARLAHRAPGIAKLTGADTAFVPARDFVDGVAIVDLSPQGTVDVYHLGFARHHRLVANGVEVESFHPGPVHALGLGTEMRALYLSCFPHVTRIDGFGAPLLPRLRLRDLDLFEVA